jgi:hypothetical protein
MFQNCLPFRRRIRRRNRRSLLPTAALVAISLSPVAFFADFAGQGTPPSVETSNSSSHQVVTHAPAAPASDMTYDRALIDPMPALSPERLAFARNAPLSGTFSPLPGQRTARLEQPAAQELAPAPQPLPDLKTAQAPQPVPLPVPRPPELRMPQSPVTPQMARSPASSPRQTRSAALPSALVDNRSFFEKLFGIQPQSVPSSALGYASLDGGGDSLAPSSRFGSPTLEARTAVYDISAKTVIMPDGERLEAHSGLGDKLDDPRYVHVRMRGATPPGTYILTEREALFHGVRALRMNPVGGSAAIHGRDGILAHTYLLGPNGDSNGCVSFKDYDRFLHAYLRGEVKRLVVVPGRGQDLLPRIVNNRVARDT